MNTLPTLNTLVMNTLPTLNTLLMNTLPMLNVLLMLDTLSTLNSPLILNIILTLDTPLTLNTLLTLNNPLILDNLLTLNPLLKLDSPLTLNTLLILNTLPTLDTPLMLESPGDLKLPLMLENPRDLNNLNLAAILCELAAQIRSTTLTPLKLPKRNVEKLSVTEIGFSRHRMRHRQPEQISISKTVTMPFPASQPLYKKTALAEAQMPRLLNLDGTGPRRLSMALTMQSQNNI